MRKEMRCKRIINENDVPINVRKKYFKSLKSCHNSKKQNESLVAKVSDFLISKVYGEGRKLIEEMTVIQTQGVFSKIIPGKYNERLIEKIKKEVEKNYILPYYKEKKMNKYDEENKNEDLMLNSIEDFLEEIDLVEIANAVTETFNRALCPKMDLDEIKNIYTRPLDKIIIRHEKETNNKFISGEFKISYLDDNHYEVAYDLYFQNINEKWIKMSSKSKPINSEKKLKPEAIEELKKEKCVIYEINQPAKD